MEFRSDMPIYLQISICIKEKIVNGEYPLTEKLPSVREFSVIFEVSALTIQRALAQLEMEGIIYPKKGVGSFITSGCFDQLEQRMLVETTKDYINQMRNLGLKNERIISLVEEAIKDGRNN